MLGGVHTRQHKSTCELASARYLTITGRNMLMGLKWVTGWQRRTIAGNCSINSLRTASSAHNININHCNIFHSWTINKINVLKLVVSVHLTQQILKKQLSFWIYVCLILCIYTYNVHQVICNSCKIWNFNKHYSSQCISLWQISWHQSNCCWDKPL